MYETSNQIKINAPVDQGWKVLTGVDRFHEWNPVIRRIEGGLTVGEAVRMTASSPEGERQWTCRISRHRDGREFAWRFIDRHRCSTAASTPSASSPSTRTPAATSMSKPSRDCSSQAAATFLPPRPEGQAGMGDALKQRAEIGA